MKTLKILAKEIKADYMGCDTPFLGISIDTRTLKKGELFVAIKGESIDGHLFVADAQKKGASACMVEKPVDCDLPQIIVADSRLGLGLLAKTWRNQFHFPMIAVTGSCGKTTVKEMLGSILNNQNNCLITEGNLNSDYGVPLMLAKLNEAYDYAVFEAGSNHLGEIKYLADLIQPDIALITNVEAAHLEGFKSLDGVMQEKGALFDCLNENGIAIINFDDQRIRTYAEKLTCKKIYFSQKSNQTDIHLVSEPFYKDGKMTFDIYAYGMIYPISLNLLGRYQVLNVLAAIGIAKALDIPDDVIISGLEALKEVKGRFVAVSLSEQIQLIDDTYNASVPSVQAAIEALAAFEGRRIFVMGHMGELGENSADYHYQMGQWLKEKKIDEVYLYGNYTLLKNTIKALPNARYYDNKAKLIVDLKSSLIDSQKTWVLVKGSRATEMETIIKDLVKG